MYTLTQPPEAAETAYERFTLASGAYLGLAKALCNHLLTGLSGACTKVSIAYSHIIALVGSCSMMGTCWHTIEQCS